MSAFAIGYDYNAGFASFGRTKALALEDRSGHRAVLVMAGFNVPLSVADMIAAQAIKEYHLDRANLLIYSIAGGDPDPQEARTAIGAALGKLEAAVLVFGNGRLTVSAADGRCLAALTNPASLEPCTTPNGDTVRGSIRAAYRMIDLTQGLQTRDTVARSVAIQAIALGKLIIFSAPENYAYPNKRIILAVTPAIPNEDQRVSEAVGEVFLRVGGRPQ